MLSFVEDDYLREAYETYPRLVITLSDGRIVYSDDERPGQKAPTWVRLRNFLEKNPEIFITKVTAGFRDNILNIGDDADGYFFVKSAFAAIDSAKTLSMWVLGTYENNILKTKRYLVPEMILVEEEIRDPLKAGECLICRQNVQLVTHTSPQQQPIYSALPLNTFLS